MMDRMPPKPVDDYTMDFCAWAARQAGLLRDGRSAEADLEHIAEEIEDLGKADRRSLASHVRTVIEHLMKLEASSAAEPRAGWRETVRRTRRDIADLLTDSPSLRRELPGMIAQQMEPTRRDVADGLADRGEDAAALGGLTYSETQLLGPWIPD